MKQSLSSYIVSQSQIPNFNSQLVINYVLSALAKHLIPQIIQKSGLFQGPTKYSSHPLPHPHVPYGVFYL